MERQVWREYTWKMQYIHQYDETDCGAACLAMIASHYKSSWTITSIREIAGTDLDRSLLRSRIGYVPQDIAIFSGSIAQNIALSSPESTLDEIILAAKRAGADSFIEDLPERYETQLGEQGMNLSGGQRQRLARARALLSTPDILILDEATSNLDAMAERIIQNTIETFKEQSITTIIIAHRLSTVIHCDKIFVLEGGLVVQEGNHHQLVQEEGLYRTMWEASH